LTAGQEVTIDTLSDLDGRFLCACPRIRLEVKSGQAYRSITIARPDLVESARRFVEGMPIFGPSNIQCFLTENGPAFFEINARFGAGTILSIQAGMNGPAALVALVRGAPLPPLAPRADVLMLRYWQEVFA
jgi:carbamoyl-phosphate synthase large subunit